MAFCSVLRSRLGSHPLLFSGEVDCMNPQAPSTQPPACYVELKTSKEMHSPGQWRSFYRFRPVARRAWDGEGARGEGGVLLTLCLSCQTQASEVVGSVVPPRGPTCCRRLPEPRRFRLFLKDLSYHGDV